MVHGSSAMFLQVRTHFNQVQHVPSSATAQVSQVREGVQRLSDSLCAAVERLANDLYESECHFLYEIVQPLASCQIGWS